MTNLTFYQKHAIAFSVRILIVFNVLLLSGFGPVLITFNGATLWERVFSLVLFCSVTVLTLSLVLVQRTLWWNKPYTLRRHAILIGFGFVLFAFSLQIQILCYKCYRWTGLVNGKLTNVVDSNNFWNICLKPSSYDVNKSIERLFEELSKTVSKEVLELRKARQDSYLILAEAGNFNLLNHKIARDLAEATATVAKSAEETKQSLNFLSNPPLSFIWDGLVWVCSKGYGVAEYTVSTGMAHPYVVVGASLGAIFSFPVDWYSLLPILVYCRNFPLLNVNAAQRMEVAQLVQMLEVGQIAQPIPVESTFLTITLLCALGSFLVSFSVAFWAYGVSKKAFEKETVHVKEIVNEPSSKGNELSELAFYFSQFSFFSKKAQTRCFYDPVYTYSRRFFCYRARLRLLGFVHKQVYFIIAFATAFFLQRTQRHYAFLSKQQARGLKLSLLKTRATYAVSRKKQGKCLCVAFVNGASYKMANLTFYQKYAIAFSVRIQVGLNVLLLSGFGPIFITFSGATFLESTLSFMVFCSVTAVTLSIVLVQKTLWWNKLYDLYRLAILIVSGLVLFAFSLRIQTLYYKCYTWTGLVNGKLTNVVDSNDFWTICLKPSSYDVNKSIERLFEELSKTVSKEVLELRKARQDSYLILAEAGNFDLLNHKIAWDLAEATATVAKAAEETKQSLNFLSNPPLSFIWDGLVWVCGKGYGVAEYAVSTGRAHPYIVVGASLGAILSLPTAWYLVLPIFVPYGGFPLLNLEALPRLEVAQIAAVVPAAGQWTPYTIFSFMLCLGLALYDYNTGGNILTKKFVYAKEIVHEPSSKGNELPELAFHFS